QKRKQNKTLLNKKPIEATNSTSVASTPVHVPIFQRDPATLFKMTKFQSVNPKIVSWRPEDDPAIVPIFMQHHHIAERSIELAAHEEERRSKKREFASFPMGSNPLTRSLPQPKKKPTTKTIDVLIQRKKSDEVHEKINPEIHVELNKNQLVKATEIPNVAFKEEVITEHKNQDIPQVELKQDENLQTRQKKDTVRFASLEKPVVREPRRNGVVEVEGVMRIVTKKVDLSSQKENQQPKIDELKNMESTEKQIRVHKPVQKKEGIEYLSYEQPVNKGPKKGVIEVEGEMRI
ncbi:hypothetical protein HK096_000896, partial [Nowakowskiella sp. JEL0078]